MGPTLGNRSKPSLLEMASCQQEQAGDYTGKQPEGPATSRASLAPWHSHSVKQQRGACHRSPGVWWPRRGIRSHLQHRGEPTATSAVSSQAGVLSAAATRHG